MPQQRRQGRLGRTPSPARLAHRAAVAGSLALLPLAVGCDAGGEEAAAERKASKKTAAVEVVAPADVEVIANLTGCKVTIRVETFGNEAVSRQILDAIKAKLKAGPVALTLD